MTATLPDLPRRRPLRPFLPALAAVAAALVAGSLAGAPHADAVPSPAKQPVRTVVPGTLTVDDPSSTLLPELNVVPVRGPQLDAALAAATVALTPYYEAVAAEEQAIAEQRAVEGRLTELRAASASLELERVRAAATLEEARSGVARTAAALEERQDDLDAARAVLDEALIGAYVAQGSRPDPTAPDGSSASGRRAQYLEHVIRAQADVVAERRRALAPFEAAHAEAVAGLNRRRAAAGLLQARLAGLAGAAGRAEADLDRAATAVLEATARRRDLGERTREAKVAVAEARRTAIVVGADFPLVVLDALVRAERYEAVARPACRLDWQLLAALSKSESGHGTYGGSRVDALGGTSSIVGPPLDPESGFGVIGDSDGGELDGDPRYDRAVGPMQFLPSSWRAYALDGNGDGVIDPRNYYDAALAAAEHLCRGGADTGTDAGRRTALYGYNASWSYVSQVLAIRERYLASGW